MSNPAIRVDRIAKRYQIGVLQHDTLRDRLAHGFNSLWRRKRHDSAHAGELWALKEVTFEVQHGEIVGIIGRNGAGKSTLLKILSHITEPTLGRIEIYGRVGSLLEVGTGFHPELTGRENIFLNGAILGMTRAEIKRKFDEIVAFSEIEAFLETPVKRYSSGMYIRLAFAVAAHLEPEILVVDEVLAVGDVAFQRKCLGKMSDVASEGRTVLFVSHNLAAVQSLCTRGLVIEDGGLRLDTDIDRAVSGYLAALESNASQRLNERTDRRGKGEVRLVGVDICSIHDGQELGTLVTGLPARFIYHTSATTTDLVCAFTLYDQYGNPIAVFRSGNRGPQDTINPDLERRFVCELDELLLVPGHYRINVSLTQQGELQDHLEAAAFVDVAQGHLRGRPVAHTGKYGSVCMHHRWITSS